MTFNEHVETLEEIEIRHQDTLCTNESHLVHPWWYNFKYTVVGILFGIVFVKAEIISWFRIQEMFQLTSFFMYGVIGTAVVVGALSIMLIKKLKLKSIYGEVITFEDKEFNKGQIYGATIFGIGWAIAGLCPGPAVASLALSPLAVLPFLAAMLTGMALHNFLPSASDRPKL